MTSLTSPADPVATIFDGTDPAPLLQPVDLVPGLRLRNRTALAPMTRKFSPGGVPGPDVAAYYARRAASVGLLVTEGTYVGEPSAGTDAAVPRIHGQDALAGWADVVRAVHDEGGVIIPQLWHLGAVRAPGSPPVPQAPVLSPSGVDAAGRVVGEPATTGDIERIVAAFARAAADARRVGFDGVELHGAHGYLIDQFLWQATNRRTDAYGGSIAAWARLAAEIVAAVREATAPDFPIVFRYSQWKGGHYDARLANDPAELDQILTPLAEAGVDVFHVSTRRYWQAAFPGSPRTLAGWTKHLTSRPVIAVGSVGVSAPFRGTAAEGQPDLSIAALVDLLESGEIDLVALGRALLADPSWVSKIAAGEPETIRPYRRSLEAVLH